MLSNVGVGLLVAAVLTRLLTESQGVEDEEMEGRKKGGNDGLRRNATYNGTNRYTAKPPKHSTSTSPRCAEWSSAATLALPLASILLQRF